jgi:hypothetical protein
MLARLLALRAEVWITRELWHLLDNLDVYAPSADNSWHPDSVGRRGEETRRALRVWDRLRQSKDLGGLRCYWVGDNLGASMLPPTAGGEVVSRFELLAAALDLCAPQARSGHAGRAIARSAARDVAALAAALGEATVLCCRRVPLPAAAGSRRSERDLPLLVRELAHFNLPALGISAEDELAGVGRRSLAALMEASGASSVLWSGLALQAVRIAVPLAEGVLSSPPREDSAEVDGASPVDPALWQGARVLWFDVYPGPSGLADLLSPAGTSRAGAAEPRAARRAGG